MPAVIQGFGISSAFVFLTNSDQLETFSVTVSDDASPISAISLTLSAPVIAYAPLVSYGRGYLGGNYATSTVAVFPTTDANNVPYYHYDRTSNGDTYTVTVPIEPGTAAGDYSVIGATVTDQAGSVTNFSHQQLAALGDLPTFHVTTDVVPPILSKLLFSSIVPVNSGIGNGYFGGFVVGATDSGVGIANIHLDFDGQVGGSDASPSDSLDFGQTGYSLPYVSAGYSFNNSVFLDGSAGERHLIDAIVTDRAGNVTEYSAATLAALGFSTSFTVVTPGDLSQTAISGYLSFAGTSGQDTLHVNGNVWDYNLSRVAILPSAGILGDEGDFVLTAKNGSGVFAVGEAVETVQFQNGQYLSLKDLPAYVSGDATFGIGANQNDLMYQTCPAGYQVFAGEGGNDRVFLNGNVGDYTMRPFTGVSDADGTQLNGLELVATNGSGAELIDSTTEVVQFKNGQYLSYGDLSAYIGQSSSSLYAYLHIIAGEASSQPVDVVGTWANDLLLLDGNASDYQLSRSASGAFVLTDGPGAVTVEENIDTVQFGNGQYLALHDLPAYLHGSAVFTSGTAADDFLFVPLDGDQFVTGGGGKDNLYLHGNTHDYALEQVALAATSDHPAINGVELVAANGSGNLYVDQSVETIHFQNGQYLSFNDLHSYIAPFHG